MTWYNIDGGDITVDWDKKAKKMVITAPSDVRYKVSTDNVGGPVIITLTEGLEL